MPTQRYEGATLEDAMQAAVRQVGPDARFLAANRVRKGGLGGFFAREHIEVEVEVPQARAKASRAPRASARAGATAAAGAHKLGPETAELEMPNDDPMAALLQEMAESGPSSILDLAEQVNHEQSRYSLVDDSPSPATPESTGAGTGIATSPSGPSSGTVNEDHPEDAFASVLERIARDSGLLSSGTEPLEAGTALALASSADLAPRTEARHADAVLTEFPAEREVMPEPAAPRQLTDLGMALHDLGLPLPACQSVMPAADRETLRRELELVLREYLPELPAVPRSASSVVVVVGPRAQVMRTARALASEMGADVEQIALATTRKLWRKEGDVIDSPASALEQRRSWRWRKGPSVVAIEQDVRPGPDRWALNVIEALEPTLAWGVAPAAHKPEDIMAWSASLGGLDLIALVDLNGTTTPAAALASVPVGRLDDAAATPEQWADVLCRRLLG